MSVSTRTVSFQVRVEAEGRAGFPLLVYGSFASTTPSNLLKAQILANERDHAMDAGRECSSSPNCFRRPPFTSRRQRRPLSPICALWPPKPLHCPLEIYNKCPCQHEDDSDSRSEGSDRDVRSRRLDASHSSSFRWQGSSTTSTASFISRLNDESCSTCVLRLTSKTNLSLVNDMPTPKARIHIALFRNDLRLHDQPMLHAAIRGHSSQEAQLLPVYCFDPRQVDLTALNGRGQDFETFDRARTWHFEYPRSTTFKMK